MTYGRHFGKSDYERYGLFAEMSYLHGQGYTGLSNVASLRDMKGRQLYPGCPKWKTGLQDCYFNRKFNRLFIGEGLPWYKKEDENDKDAKKDDKGAKVQVFRPPSCIHLHSTPGDPYGCFTKKIKAFDPRVRKPGEPTDKKKGKSDKDKAVDKGIFKPTNPGKKGGCGYANVTLSRFPKYIPSAYEPKTEDQPDRKKKKDAKETKPQVWKPPIPGDLFDRKPYKTTNKFWKTYINTYPAVWARATFIPPNPTRCLGGCMDGCFHKWPKYIHTKYIEPWKVSKYVEELENIKRSQKKSGDKKKPKETPNQKFIPPSRNKTYPMKSIADSKAYLSTNSLTWRTAQPVTYTREFI